MRTNIPVDGGQRLEYRENGKVKQRVLLADHISDEVYGMMRRVEALRGVAVGTVIITAKDEGELMFSDQTRLLKGAKHPEELPQHLTPETKKAGQLVEAWRKQVTGRFFIDISPEGTLKARKQFTVEL